MTPQPFQFGLQPQSAPLLGTQLPPVAPPLAQQPVALPTDPWATLLPLLLAPQQQRPGLDFSALLHPASRHLDMSGQEISPTGGGPWGSPMKFNDRATQQANDATASAAVAGSSVPNVNSREAQMAGAVDASPAPAMPNGAMLDPRLFAADPARTGESPASMQQFDQQLYQPGGYASLLSSLVQPQKMKPRL